MRGVGRYASDGVATARVHPVAKRPLVDTFAGGIRRRPTKPQVAAVALTVCLSIGPVVGLATIVSRNPDPVATLVEGRTPPEDGAEVDIAFTTVTPTAGTMTALIQVSPFPELLVDGGLAEDMVLRVNDALGDTSVTFSRGQIPRAVSVTLPLRGGSIERYPFDRYQSAVLMSMELATQSDDGEPTRVPFTVDVSSQLGDFTVKVDSFRDGNTRAMPAVGIAFELSRAATATAYAVGVMVLMWGLALTGVAILWVVTMRSIPMPPWSIGYLVGVLFALAPLRSSLPGSPPPGTLLDFVAFYWCIAIVGFTTIALLSVWLQRTRPPKSRAAAPSHLVENDTPAPQSSE